MKLYSKNKKGKTLVWWAESDYKLNANGHIEINIYYGQLDGKIQHKLRVCESGKNIGKSNETSIIEQAKLDISYLYSSQKDKDYFEDISFYMLTKKAMLASVFQDHIKKFKLENDNDTLVSTYYTQPKLNGIRCMVEKVSETEVVFLSRENLVFTYFPNIAKALLKLDLPVGARIDGELFNKDLKFEYISSIVNSETERYVLDESTGAQIANESDIQIHIYDYIKNDPNKTFEERLKERDELLSKNTSSLIVQVKTEKITKFSEIEIKYELAMKDKYEGLMIRLSSGYYEYSYRSLFLFKYKKMKEAEFKIVNISSAKNEPTKPIFTIEVEKNIFCNVALEGDKTLNSKYLTNKEDYLQDCYWLTTQYQEKTRHGNLAFPVGIQVRKGTVNSYGMFIPDI